MELQKRGYSCGPAALRAVLYVYGRSFSEAGVRRWAGTTPEGTDEDGIKKAIAHYGFRQREHQTSSIRDATNWIKGNLRKGNPMLLCVDAEAHWIAVVGMLGKKIMVFDPAKKKNGRLRYSGLRLYHPSDLAVRMSHVEDGIIQYYGMVVLPGKE